MIREGINKILEISKPEIIEHDGRKFSSKPFDEIRKAKPSLLEFNTLDGFLDYVLTQTEPGFIQVYDETDVKFICERERGQHHVLARATTAKYVDNFCFGRKYGKEEFIIDLMSKFHDTSERQLLLEVCGRLKAEKVIESNDDGVSQTVSQRKGSALSERATIKNPIELAPYRTFREIPQPISNFIFRVHQVEDELPKMSLSEADGQGWRLNAILCIGTYLNEKIALMKRSDDIEVFA